MTARSVRKRPCVLMGRAKARRLKHARKIRTLRAPSILAMKTPTNASMMIETANVLAMETAPQSEMNVGRTNAI